MIKLVLRTSQPIECGKKHAWRSLIVVRNKARCTPHSWFPESLGGIDRDGSLQEIAPTKLLGSLHSYVVERHSRAWCLCFFFERNVPLGNI